MVVSVWDRLHNKALGNEKRYKHDFKNSKENEQATRLQNFLDGIFDRTGGESSKW